MKKRDIKDLLLGKAIRFLEGKNFKYWELIGKIDFIINNNVYYESYDLESMEKELVEYLLNLKGE